MTSARSATDQEAPEGQTPFTRADFDALTPEQQGYVSYYQAAWNKAIPDESPYQVTSKKHHEWRIGRIKAVIEVQDGDD